ncbi:MAG TPA: MerR family transcriptional regulator [Nannocystis exedens]|nr:MerR family transcriptional regulator [Nannocystis exedens]
MTMPVTPAEASAQADGSPEQLYRTRDVSRLFGLPESRLRYWAQTGFIRPSRRIDGGVFYDFRDLIAIKVAKELLAAGLSLQRVRRSLAALKTKLPGVTTPLARLRIRCEHDTVIVDESEHAYEAQSGQVLLNFAVESLREEVAQVLTLPLAKGGESALPCDAYEWFLRGCEREAEWDGIDPEDPAFVAAKEAYERAIDGDPGLASAYTNLGALLAAGGDLDGARDNFDQALYFDSEQPEAQANLAALALRSGDPETAAAGYRLLLEGCPDHLEGHYGLARALIEIGAKDQALAHLQRFLQAVARLHPEDVDDELEHRRIMATQVAKELRRDLGVG